MDEVECPATAHQVKRQREVEAEVVVAKNPVERPADADAGAERREIAEIAKVPDLIGRCERGQDFFRQPAVGIRNHGNAHGRDSSEVGDSGFSQGRFFCPDLRGESGLEKGGELGDDVALAAYADRLVLLGSAFEVDERRDAADAELRRDAGSVVNIDFGDREFSHILAGDLIHHRSEHAAGRTPWGPEINQHRGGGGFDERGEIRVVEFGYIGIGHKRNVVC